MRALFIVVLATACGRIGFAVEGSSTSTNDGATSRDGNTTAVDAAPGTLLPATSADTYLKSLDSMPNGALQGLLCGRDSGNGNDIWTLLAFDLGAITQPQITTATLRLFQTGGVGTTTLAYQVYRVTEPWDEATADWSNRTATATWMTAGGTVAPTVYAMIDVPPDVFGYYDWNITQLVNQWLEGAFPNYGLELQYAIQPATGNYVLFASKDHPTVAWRPQLLITP